MATHKHRTIRRPVGQDCILSRQVTNLSYDEHDHLSPPASSLQPPASKRRGVILLVLLGLLALFAATVFAFLVIASHGNKVAKSLQKVDRVIFSPQGDMEEAMRQVLRDTKVRTSVVRGHSLMLDLYGDTSVGGWVINAYTVVPDAPGSGYPQPKGLAKELLPGITTPINSHQSSIANGQLIEFTAGYTLAGGLGDGRGYWGGLEPPEHASPGTLAGGTGGPVAYNPPINHTLTIPEWFGDKTSNTDSGGVRQANEAVEFHRHVGSVLTVIDPSSALYNKSTRIVSYRPVPISENIGGTIYTVTYHRYQVLPFEDVSAAKAVNYFATTRSSGYNFVINGAPFSGAGAGYNPNVVEAAKMATNDWGYTGSPFSQPYALLPNPTDPDYHNAAGGVTYTPYSPNEDYDAPDYQNMLMALEHWDPTANGMIVRSPSLHRPALADYWIHYLLEFIDNAIPSVDEADVLRLLIQPYGQDGIRASGDELPVVFTAALRDAIVQVKRRCLMRPLALDHGNFDGSNVYWITGIGDTLPAGNTAPVIADLRLRARRAWGARDVAAGAGPWDVDNDGDGVPDSIWVDIGLPVRSLPDGRKYKPLVAMHCIDLDGRINLNTAGTVEQLHNKFSDMSSGNPDPPDELRDYYYLGDGVVYAQPILDGTGPAVGSASDVVLDRGQGCGPAEISLYPAFFEIVRNDTTLTPRQKHDYAMLLYRNLLLGWKGPLNGNYTELDGRYGELRLRSATEFYQPGAGVSGTAESLALARLFGMPGNYNYVSYLQNNALVSPWGSPLDLKGTMTVGLDLFGQPIYSAMRGVSLAVDPYGSVSGFNTNAFAWSLTDTPYEMKLGQLAAQSVGPDSRLDNPYTIAEFEPFLRRFDTDILRLPGRLRQLLNAGPNAPYRTMATTESWDIPVPSLAFPKELLDDWRALGEHPNNSNWIRPPAHVADLITARIYSLDSNGVAVPVGLERPSDFVLSNDAVEGAKRVNVAQLLGTDLLSGLRMDLNCPFGNGRDDDGDGIVDEPSERLTLAAAGSFEMFNATVRFDHDNDGFEWQDHNQDGAINPATDDDPTATPPGALAEHVDGHPAGDPIYKYRQAYAQHLYVLMMALVDEAWYPEWDPTIARGFNNNSAMPFNPTPAQQQAARARAIAQWAINVVDFRDSDSIMTPFEYDIYPFAAPAGTAEPGQLISTWDADGDVSAKDPNCDIVYGCERPELLITETLAFHDRRTEDTDEDPTNEFYATEPDGNLDFDQKYRPLGSFYVELYNPSSLSEPSPAELYHDNLTDTDTGGIVLTQTTQQLGGGDPVWRLAVTASTPSGGTIDYGYVDPDDATDEFMRERLVYFIQDNGSLPQSGVGPTDYKVVYSPSALQPAVDPTNFSAVLPRRYMVVGPGMDDGGGGVNTLTQIGDVTSGTARRIKLDPTAAPQVEVFGDGTNDDVLAMLPNIHQPTAIVIDYPQRLSVSEPTDATGYNALKGASAYDPVSQLFTPPTDAPLDSLEPGGGPNPEWAGKLGEDGTHAAFRYVHLQRLADPTRDYDPLANPYRTVDTAPVDLTVFNGRDNSVVPEPTVTAGTYPQDGAGELALISRQRGDGLAAMPALWQSHIPLSVGDRPSSNQTPAAVPNHLFDKRFAHTLGWLNEWYGEPLNPATFNVDPSYRGAPGQLDTTVTPNEFNPRPFPWITWYNRPFANPLDLLQVPAVESSRLLVTYENDLTKAPSPPNSYSGGYEGFAHLTPFFAARPPASDAIHGEGKLRGVANDFPDDIPVTNAANFYRILEYVHVPTRFVNSYIHGTDQALMGNQLFSSGTPQPPHLFHPPFNVFSHYREPGKMNLNSILESPATIPESLVWRGLASDDTELAGKLYNFYDARRAYDATTGSFNLEFSSVEPPPDPPLPTRLANPFRSFAGEYLLPTLPGRDSATPYFPDVVQEGVNTTLLRALVNPANYNEPLNNRAPLFANSTANGAYDNYSKDPFFQYQSLGRLSNLTTTRSNVYALWITVGNFEVQKYDRYNPSALAWHKHVYPDGYTLGRELGVESGDVTRHRAFYVIDRSIPVGFVPGEDMNTDKAVILKRFIE